MEHRWAKVVWTEWSGGQRKVRKLQWQRQGRSNKKETGPAGVRRKSVKRRGSMAGLAKQDKKGDGRSCEARQEGRWQVLRSKTSRAQHGPFPAGGLGGAVSPPAGTGAEPRKLLKISHFPITKLTGVWETLAQGKCLDCSWIIFVLKPFLFFFAQNWSGHGRRIGPFATALKGTKEC